ncbi:MAG: phosphate-binding protein [Zetaproteobacteria bacterium CG06_land_8_20_14_3_00_59_53]|nr:MAG: phosphate-binding protein [Zetaproteobacteria bacterium CG2_30_59_37]PIO89394.1 MAG: phosphate-binding protein [Zetaproteobacteria bacterium CG23_combo_of_CG06-09_8_20_14_all_59_86]PIQ65672.1 MAG: phosphate-binding protein [Zetaproteobacteria bacterium CG11_big_fil_rev_8_21_14_0_20_59_439]PIU70689.1 MAG: phosphate-binding protein [Zetaproteobacteria bacterium CG06_land_8_20_14_3_00_59_53]PIU98039.1 MAG: phosphate-binding protein [Zetaproteobacteria bacterium CG03_land_8_20_14_0_80_59_51
MYKHIFTAAFVAIAAFATIQTADAREIRIVGSSTVFPFSSANAEEFGATTRFKTPVVESTGSGGGFKLFCAGDDLNTPDISNASRRMKAKELELCAENGVKGITEAVIGYDGIAVAQSADNAPINLSREEIMLAVAAEVPSKDGKSLVANPYHYWNEINPDLPKRKIVIYGPPASSGTRDAFEDMILKHLTKHMDVYTNLYHADKVKNKAYKKFHKIRQDDVYVPSGENDNLIVQKLTKDKDAFGVFGYSFLEENKDKVSGALINGISPNPETISSGNYPLSRSLYFYIKHSHVGKVDGIQEYANLFMSEKQIGNNGTLLDIGLIALPEADRARYRKQVEELAKLTEGDLKK